MRSCDTCGKEHSRKQSKYCSIECKRKKNISVRNGIEGKVCSGCNKWKSLVEYTFSVKSKGYLHSKCKKCNIKKSRKWQIENKDRANKNKDAWIKKNPDYHLLRSYNITREVYDGLLAKQNGTCAICHKKNTNGRLLSVDHDHECCPGDISCGKCVRGLLCGRCNVGLGYFLDDVASVKRAVEYLEYYG